MKNKSKMWASLGVSAVGITLVVTGSPIVAAIVVVCSFTIIWG